MQFLVFFTGMFLQHIVMGYFYFVFWKGFNTEQEQIVPYFLDLQKIANPNFSDLLNVTPWVGWSYQVWWLLSSNLFSWEIGQLPGQDGQKPVKSPKNLWLGENKISGNSAKISKVTPHFLSGSKNHKNRPRSPKISKNCQVFSSISHHSLPPRRSAWLSSAARTRYYSQAQFYSNLLCKIHLNLFFLEPWPKGPNFWEAKSSRGSHFLRHIGNWRWRNLQICARNGKNFILIIFLYRKTSPSRRLDTVRGE